MAEAAKSSSFRLQMCRLAWVMTFSMFAMAALMWVTSDTVNETLGEMGFGLFFGVCLLSVLARRFAPLGWALLGLLVLGLATR